MNTAKFQFVFYRNLSSFYCTTTCTTTAYRNTYVVIMIIKNKHWDTDIGNTLRMGMPEPHLKTNILDTIKRYAHYA